MAEIVKITKGQPFSLYVPLVILKADGSKEAVDAASITNENVTLQGVCDTIEASYDTFGRYLVLKLPATLNTGEYAVVITATLASGRAFALRIKRAFGVVDWDEQSNWRDYLVGDHIELCDQPFIAGEFTTDAEYEALKQQLRADIAEAEQAKADAEAEKVHYAEAVEQLDDLARQGDNPNATNTQILYDVNHIVVPPPTGMAKESTLTAGITALQNAITALYGGDLTATLSALKTAIANISIDTDDLAKADALAAVQSDIDALEVLVGATSDTSTDETIFGKFAAVLAAVAGISGFATPTDVSNAQTAIIAAMPSVSGLATETNATSNKQAILDAISALSIPTVQQIQAGLALDNTVAKEATLGTTADSSVATTIFGWLKVIWDKLFGIVTTYPYAKEATLGTSSDTSSNSTIFGKLAAIISSLTSVASDASDAKTAILSNTYLNSDVNAGKTALATAITNKGVTTLPTQSMQDMAQNISSITQETIVLDGGDVYAKQLFGSPSNSVVPGFWNLYEVMTYLLSKTSTEQYSILLCEFPKNESVYSFGGTNVSTPIPVGYVFSDDYQQTGEGSTNIHPNTDTSHTWDDAIDTKGNHWIAWLFSQVVEGATAPAISLGAAGTNAPQPRSIYIGRKIGDIILTANSAVREFVVIDGNKLNSFLQNGYSCNFLPTAIIRNTTILGNSYLSFASNVEKIFVHTEHVSLSQANGTQIITTGASSIGSIVIDCDDITIDRSWNSYIVRGVSGSSIGSFIIKANSIKCPHGSGHGDNGKLVRYVTSVKSIYLIGLEECSQFDIVYNNTPTTEYIYIGYDTNDKTKTVALGGSGTLTTLTDIELQDGWRKPLSISFATSLTESNIYAHILQRLKQDEAGCGDGVTIVLGQTNINKLTSNDNPNRVRDITLLNTLIGTYGYAFTGYTPITLE